MVLQAALLGISRHVVDCVRFDFIVFGGLRQTLERYLPLVPVPSFGKF